MVWSGDFMLQVHIYEQVMFERRVLLLCTIVIAIAIVLWSVAISTDYWFVLDGGEGIYIAITKRFFLYSHTGVFRICRFVSGFHQLSILLMPFFRWFFLLLFFDFLPKFSGNFFTIFLFSVFFLCYFSIFFSFVTAFFSDFTRKFFGQFLPFFLSYLVFLQHFSIFVVQFFLHLLHLFFFFF